MLTKKQNDMKNIKEIEDYLKHNTSLTRDEVKTFIDWVQEGDFVPGEFYYNNRGEYEWIIHCTKYIDKEPNRLKYDFNFCVLSNKLLREGQVYHIGFKKATEEQKQLLIDRVKKVYNLEYNETDRTFQKTK